MGDCSLEAVSFILNCGLLQKIKAKYEGTYPIFKLSNKAPIEKASECVPIRHEKTWPGAHLISFSIFTGKTDISLCNLRDSAFLGTQYNFLYESSNFSFHQ